MIVDGLNHTDATGNDIIARFILVLAQLRPKPGFLTQISGEVPPTVKKPGFFAILAIATVPLQYYSLLERDKTARKRGCHRTVRQTARRLKNCIADRQSPMTDD